MKLARLSLLASTIVLGASMLLAPLSAHALNGSEFKPGRIIDDAVFTNKDSMTVQQIQQFLNAKVPSCEIFHSAYNASNPPPYTCLKDYQENTTTGANNFGQFSGSTPVSIAGGKSSAQIIWEASQAYNINPQVMIVLLQKEQGLVTDTWPLLSQFTKATGYLCPDTAACNSNAGGFSKQVFGAAWQFRNDLNGIDTPGFFSVYGKGLNNIRLNPNAACGTKSVNIENQATAVLYKYTPYTPNTAALNNLNGLGDGCSAYGNRNFWIYFTEWFGNTTLPLVAKSPNGSIYVIANSFRFYIPTMALLHDYGFDPGSIPLLSDLTINSIPLGDTLAGQSSSIGYLVKSPSDSDDDGGSIYVVTVGKRYSVISMSQFNNFGFNVSDISYLPLGYIQSIVSGGQLDDYIQTPTNNAFKIEAGKKRIILNYQKYVSLNPSNSATKVSYFLSSILPSSDPITDTPILFKYSSGAVSIFVNNKYYVLPSIDVYNCWNFESGNAGPLFALSEDSFIPITDPQVLSCSVQKSNTINFLLNKSNKYTLDNSAGFNITAYNNVGLDSLIDTLSTTSSPLKPYISSAGNPGIWKIDQGKKRLVPNMKNFNLLQIDSSKTTRLETSTVKTIIDGAILLGNGALVKTTDNSTVYVIADNERIAFSAADDFTAYGNSWLNIETYSKEFLDTTYPFNAKSIQRYVYKSSNSQVYIIDSGKCFAVSDLFLTEYGKIKSNIITQQNYSEEAYATTNFSACDTASNYIKSSNSAAVYKLVNGAKTGFASWQQLISSNNGIEPRITSYSDNFINSLP